MKESIQKTIALIIVFIIITYSSCSVASTLSELEDEQSSVSDAIDEAEEDLEEITTEKSETLEQVEALISEISEYQKEIEEIEEEIEELQASIEEAEEQIAEDEKEYEEQQEALNERLVAMYKTGETSYLDFMLSSTSLIDFISSYYLVSQITDYDTKMLQQLEEHRQKIEDEKNELEASKTELETAEAELEEKQSELETAKAEKEEYAEQLSEEEKEAEETLQDLQDANDELEKKIKEKEEEIAAAKAAAIAAAAASESTSSSYSTSSSISGTESSYGLIWPVLSKYSITTGWYYSTGALHGAVDFSGSGIYGTPVYAVADGYVVSADWGINGAYNGYGNCIFIAHYNGLWTLYAHLSSIVVSEGETVTQGQVIGYVGSTGNSTGPHLHFEVRTGGGSYSERVNPIYYLP